VEPVDGGHHGASEALLEPMNGRVWIALNIAVDKGEVALEKGVLTRGLVSKWNPLMVATMVRTRRFSSL